MIVGHQVSFSIHIEGIYGSTIVGPIECKLSRTCNRIFRKTSKAIGVILARVFKPSDRAVGVFVEYLVHISLGEQ